METKPLLNLWYVRVLIVLSLIGLVIALLSYSNLASRQAEYANFGPTTISVAGEGEVLAKPDIGQFSFSVRAEGVDAATAQNSSAESINAIMDYLKDNGVEEKDIKTENYYLSPKYRYEERMCLAGSYCPPGERVLDGYEVSQMVRVKVRDLDKAGDLISGVGEKGATDISNLQFTIDDESALKAEAREKAIADAKQKAEELADDLDVRLVRIINFWEDEGRYSPYYGMGGSEDMMMETKAAVSPSVPTGENSVVSRINITYEIR